MESRTGELINDVFRNVASHRSLEMSGERKERNHGLDALRGLAAIGVAFTHFLTTYYSIYGGKGPLAFDVGAPAVALFFIVSGFVILMTLERSKTLTDFGIARFARLYPVFWASVLLTFTVVRAAGLPGRQTSIRDMLLNLTMVPSAFGARPVDVVYWSLTVEVYFYFIIAAIFASGLRGHLTVVLRTLLIAGGIDHFVRLARFPGGFRVEQMLDLGWWPLFLFGITFYQMGPRIRKEHVINVLLCAFVSLVTDWRTGTVNCILAAAVFTVTRVRVPTPQWLLYFGTISYSFYLIHCNIGYCVMRWLLYKGSTEASAALAAFIFTTAIASVMCFAVEQPSNRSVRKLLLRQLTARRLRYTSAA